MDFDLITFDCYGTLIDWEGGISRAFASVMPAGALHSREAIISAYANAEAEVEAGVYRTYREVLGEASQRAASSLGWRIPRGQEDFLAASLPSWTPFPDSNAALEKLREDGCQLAILSNIDDDLIALTLQHFTTSFEFVITAGQLRSYKPQPDHWLVARPRAAGRRWLHAAQSNYHDIVPANRLGIPTAWINRGKQTALPGGRPRIEVPDLAGLADLLAVGS